MVKTESSVKALVGMVEKRGMRAKITLLHRLRAVPVTETTQK